MYQPKYNSKELIELYLNDLTGLNKLASDRRDAGYTRNERLEDFIILGRWVTDRCGNFGKILSNYSSVIPAEAFKGCPPVMTLSEYNKLRLGDDGSISWGIGSELPPDYVKCAYCELPWTIKDAHDCRSQSTTEVIDATPFIGATLFNIEKLPQFDLNHHRVTTDHVRHKDQIEGSSDVGKDYKIQDGDKIFAHVWNYSHIECRKLNEVSKSIEEINDLLNKVESINEFKLILMKNQYHSDYNEPWYRVKFSTYFNENSTYFNENHEISIGWRKRVIKIDWSKSGKDLQHLFESENVTKEANMIHAYGYEKAAEYLNKIIPAL